MTTKMDRIQKRYRDWMCNKSPEEQALHLQAIDYQDRYFKDLTLREKRIRKRLASHKVEIDGEWVDEESDLEICLTGARWIFRYRRFRDDTLGLCEYRKRTISIKRGLEGDDLKSVLLHEMIHAYEDTLYPTFRDWLLIDLHERMTKKLGNRTVLRCMDTSNHAVLHEAHHGPFFLLKSLELDERMGWKRGSVFGYRRGEWL